MRLYGFPRASLLFGAILFGPITASCTDLRGSLSAPDGTRRLVARDGESGVTVVITTAAWDGAPTDWSEQVTVLHVLVDNGGRDPLVLSPRDISLRDERGFVYDLYDPGGHFEAAGDGPKDPYRVPTTGLHVRPISPISEDIASAAMPWGVLQPGTQMRGFLYFEKVEDRANRAEFTWSLGGPDGFRVQVPLIVLRDRS